MSFDDFGTSGDAPRGDSRSFDGPAVPGGIDPSLDRDSDAVSTRGRNGAPSSTGSATDDVVTGSAACTSEPRVAPADADMCDHHAPRDESSPVDGSTVPSDTDSRFGHDPVVPRDDERSGADVRTASEASAIGSGVDSAASPSAPVFDPVAVLAADPFAMSSVQRRELMVDLQRLVARADAVSKAALVAECGAVPRVREVRVAVDVDARRREAVVAAGGRGSADADVRFVNAATRVVSFTDEVVDELAALLHRSHGSIAYELRRARLLHAPLRPVRDALAAGTITPAHAAVICDQATRMQPAAALPSNIDAGAGTDATADAADPTSDGASGGDDTADASISQTDQPGDNGAAPADAETEAEFAVKCARLCATVLPVAQRSTPGKTRSQAARLVASIDAAAERVRRQRAKARMNVVAVAEDDGLASIIATMPAIDAAALMAQVDAHARATMTSDTPLLTDPTATLGQHRTAALLHLLDMPVVRCANESVTADAGREPSPVAARLTTPSDLTAATRPVTRVEVQVLVDARVLAGTVEGSGWVQAGSGDLTAVDRDDILTLLADPATPSVLRRLLVDPASGALVDRGARTYTPTPDLVAWLATRDQTCRFPGCTTKAQRCDIDHARDFTDGGPTTLANTGLLCRRHHNRKTHAGWRITDSRADGSCVVVAPDGSHHRHFPTTLTDLMPQPPQPPPPTAEVVTNRPSCGHSAAQCPTTTCTAPYGRTPTGEPFPF